jgi:hypothetical protein
MSEDTLKMDPIKTDRAVVCAKAVESFQTLLVVICFVLVAPVQAADQSPVVRWDFDAEEVTPLLSVGGVHRDVPGPRPPMYPDFSAKNTAVKLDGRGARFTLEDSGVQSPFDFANGDVISIEAWVQVDKIRPGENAYVIGKGRTGSKDFLPGNQNWALRLRETGERAGISFLFATDPAGGANSRWHRWTTHAGFAAGKLWHHVAITYQFGKPNSMRGWIDGQPQPGDWDLDGTTDAAPVVDDDAIWIGSALGGAASNSFRGSLDAIAVYRSRVDDALMKSRFRRVGGPQDVVTKPAAEVMPELGELNPGQVSMTFHEGMPKHNRWLNDNEEFPAETMRWQTEAFLLDRLPQRFDAWGIREDWQRPVLMRFAADVPLTPGSHQFVMRVRGLSRLWVNAQVVARSKPLTGSPSGEEPVTPVTEPLRPGMRVAEHRQQEVLGEATIGPDRRCRVVLETMVGGKDFRTDPGEVCVAVESEDGKSFELLQSSADEMVLLTDSGVAAALSRQETALQDFDDDRRRAAASGQDDFWESRHAAARKWATEHPAPSVPSAAEHPIGAFVDSKIERALAASAQGSLAEARQFHNEVLPILRDNCFRCHGNKSKGGLLLDSRESVIKGGDSETPAVTPGHAEESELLRRVRSDDIDEVMPPGGGLSAASIGKLEAWIQSGAEWPAPPVTESDVAAPALLNDTAFVRRVFLDIVGVIPSEQDVRSFLENTSPDKRMHLIDRLLVDERFADHWMAYWQDVLAENPTLINASLNTTGPFRWFLYDALRDNKPLDRLVTELLLLRGSLHEGGSAGFGIAANNDAPMAAKGQIVAGAFFEHQKRDSLIRVTLKPDEAIEPVWPFAEVTGAVDDETLTPLIQNGDDSRYRLAGLITAPQNTRFAQVIVNRVWRRLMGAGIVEPPDDWEGHDPSHQDLLAWLAHEFVANDYDIKYIMRLILTSEVYQRTATGENRSALPEQRFFVAPDRRRMSAEQVVDSLFVAAGQNMDVEELTFDPDGRRPASNRLTLGVPRRSWMFASLANERDRPSLGLPRARAITDAMKAFGWNGSRQNPRTDREVSANVLQPGVLANSTVSVLLTRAAEHSGLAELAVNAMSPDELVDSVFLRYLSRLPTEAERGPLVHQLSVGFARRLVPVYQIKWLQPLQILPKVTWSNHQRSKSNTIALELEQRARAGTPPDPRLTTEWREVYEDVVWSVVNLSEFVWVP